MGKSLMSWLLLLWPSSLTITHAWHLDPEFFRETQRLHPLNSPFYGRTGAVDYVFGNAKSQAHITWITKA
jgi:hypothetical protein